MIEIRDLVFRYPRSTFELSIEHLTVAAGEKVAFVGPSGSGKTTLLNVISGIARPDRGQVTVDGQQLHELSDSARRAFRISRIGFVFQRFELIEYLRALDNILLAYSINRALRLDAATRHRARQLASELGLGDKLARWVHQLSQGEQQRVAIARALMVEPRLVLADEPTGSLDPHNKQRICDLLFSQVMARQATLVVVTHDTSLLDRFDRVVDFERFHAARRP
jgi:ABC-type lipoprotein export system ATPase subunit